MKALIKLSLCFSLVACASSKNSTNENLSGNWELTVFPESDKNFEEVFGQRRPELQFDITKATVSGTTGCNRLTGGYSVSQDQFHFANNLITTKMACPGYEENIFLNALAKVNRYEINNGQLRFLHDSALVMSFVRKQ